MRFDIVFVCHDRFCTMSKLRKERSKNSHVLIFSKNDTVHTVCLEVRAVAGTQGRCAHWMNWIVTFIAYPMLEHIKRASL